MWYVVLKMASVLALPGLWMTLMVVVACRDVAARLAWGIAARSAGWVMSSLVMIALIAA